MVYWSSKMAEVRRAGVRSAARARTPLDGLAMPRLTPAAWQPWVPVFDPAWHAHLAAWRVAGPPRTARRWTPDPTGPRPPPADRRGGSRIDRTTPPRHGAHGRMGA